MKCLRKCVQLERVLAKSRKRDAIDRLRRQKKKMLYLKEILDFNNFEDANEAYEQFSKYAIASCLNSSYIKQFQRFYNRRLEENGIDSVRNFWGKITPKIDDIDKIIEFDNYWINSLRDKKTIFSIYSALWFMKRETKNL